MKVRKRAKKVHVSLDIIEPAKLSKTGKTMVVASSNGPRRTSLRVGGKPVIANVALYYHRYKSRRRR